MYSPVKFAHSLPKKCRNTSNWELCVICQINTPDSLSCATEKGRDTLFDAINKRQDDVYRRLYDEFNSLSLVPLNEIKYHRSCYKAYTSKRNLQRFVSDVPECSNTSNDASVSTMKTRSKTLPQINWDYFIFCRQKTIKKDSNLSALKAANTCIHSCFKENETRDFYSPISRFQLKTFEDLTKRCNLKKIYVR